MAGPDSTDCRILQSLQVDASQSLADIAEQVHLSPNAYWHRIKHLEADGTILKRVVILDPAKLGIGVTAFVLLKLQLADIASYDESYKRLIRSAHCADVSAVFSMQEIRRTTAVPMSRSIQN